MDPSSLLLCFSSISQSLFDPDMFLCPRRMAAAKLSHGDLCYLASMVTQTLARSTEVRDPLSLSLGETETRDGGDEGVAPPTETASSPHRCTAAPPMETASLPRRRNAFPRKQLDAADTFVI